MNNQLSDQAQAQAQITVTNPIKKSNDPSSYSKFKTLKSLPNSFYLNKIATKINIIAETDPSLCDIPLPNTCPKRNSLCGNLFKIKYEKAVTSLPLKLLNTNAYIPLQPQNSSVSSRILSNNEISYKERKLIRQLTTNTNNNTRKNSKDNEYQDTFNQTTQFKSFQTNYIATDSIDGFMPPIPLQTNLDLLTESNEESEVSTNQILEKKKKKRNNLLRLMKANPYQSLKHNVYYNFRKNQLNYKQYLPKKPILNGMKSKEEGALYKINQYSTLYIKNKPKPSNIILRLLARKHEIPLEFKNVIFWKGIQWLWNNFFVQIEKLLVSFQYYKWFLEKEKITSLKKVEEFLLLIQLQKYKDFCDALFLIFEESNSKGINLKFALTVLIATNNTAYGEQVKEMVEVWESGKSGRVFCNEINEIIRNLLTNSKDIKTLLNIIKNSFEIRDWSNETITKSDLLTLLLTDAKIQLLIKRNYVDIDKIDQVFKEEILNLFNINMRNSKMNLEAHDAQKFCENDINRYEKVLLVLSNNEIEKQKRKAIRVNNGDGDISDD